MINGRKIAVIHEYVIDRNIEIWKNSIICYSLEQQIDPGGFAKFISRYWKLRAPYRVYGRPGGFVLVEFDNGDNKDRILQSGPWFLNGHLVILRQWVPCMELKKDLLKTILVWVNSGIMKPLVMLLQ